MSDVITGFTQPCYEIRSLFSGSGPRDHAAAPTDPCRASASSHFTSLLQIIPVRGATTKHTVELKRFIHFNFKVRHTFVH